VAAGLLLRGWVKRETGSIGRPNPEVAPVTNRSAQLRFMIQLRN